MGRTSHATIAKWWINQTTDFAEGSNMSFQGKVLYHGTSGWRMVIGILTDRIIGNKTLVLSLNEDLGGRGWGNRSPQDHMRRAVDYYTHHTLPLPAGLMELAQLDLDAALAQWPAWEISRYQERWDRLARPQTGGYGYPEGREERCAQVRSDYDLMCANAFNLGVAVPDECAAALEKAIARINEAFDRFDEPKAVAKREKAAAYREKVRKREIAKALARIAGGLEERPRHVLPRWVQEHVIYEWKTNRYTILQSGWDILKEVDALNEKASAA